MTLTKKEHTMKTYAKQMRYAMFWGIVSMLAVSCSRETETEDVTLTSEESIYLAEELGAKRKQVFEEGPTQGQVKERLAQRGNHNDMLPTGFHVAPFDTLKVKVTQLTGNRLPQVVVGTPFRDNVRPLRTYYSLEEGNNIFVADEYGGTVYVRYVTTEAPDSSAEIKFQDGFKKVPYYVKGATTKSEWLQMLDIFDDVRDVMFVTDHAMLTVGLEDAIAHKDEDQDLMCEYLDRIMEAEGAISGLDGSSPVHENREYKFLLTVRAPEAGGYMAASIALYFTRGVIDRLLMPEKLGGMNGWGPWHEAGHVHQQAAWTWSEVGEATVNIYSLAAERAFGLSPSRVSTNGEWPVVETYLALPDADRNFNSSAASHGIRMAMFHQLWLAYGDDFYIRLHKETREENPDPGTNSDRMRYFMLKSCTISGYDLTDFFRKWGLPVARSVYDEIAALNLPAPEEDLTLLRDEE
ncbi:M60 family metallopeptidase [Sinomicrobium kalidii]|uniref:M60 family metallopeptidase n=1 Tax=Sinomicrobium kalidii TaxID=2900738 RepID=UPI001E5910DC|nr:M60 family metallopeptidase [Sinomicrobium kalidii]UGU16661.1 M60 family metallopeptidase [Sinomicrobium kalidii]